jgi:hypothetical protein
MALDRDEWGNFMPWLCYNWHTAPDIQWIEDWLGPRTGVKTGMERERERERERKREREREIS